MEILVYVVVYGAAIVLDAGVLALSLFVMEGAEVNSFKEYGVLSVYLRCLAIGMATMLLLLIPYGLAAALVAWFAGIMLLFHKTLGQSMILAFVNLFVGCGIYGGINWLLGRLLVWEADCQPVAAGLQPALLPVGGTSPAVTNTSTQVVQPLPSRQDPAKSGVKALASRP